MLMSIQFTQMGYTGENGVSVYGCLLIENYMYLKYFDDMLALR